MATAAVDAFPPPNSEPGRYVVLIKTEEIIVTNVVGSPRFHEPLIFELLEEILRCSGDGVDLRRSGNVKLLRRVAESTEGYPSDFVQDVYMDVFLRDLWEKLPPDQRRPGVVRRATLERLVLATWPE
jgi:hypothetical protein